MAGDRKKIGILIILSGLIIIIAIVYFLIIKNNYQESNLPDEEVVLIGEPDESMATNPGNAPINYQRYDINSEEPRQTTADDLGKLSMSVAERFGSFSSQSNYGNFTDLKILMTQDMKNWVDNYIVELRNRPDTGSETYYGITTKAINYQIKSFNDETGQAEIIVNTQRRESTNDINGGEPYNQDLRLVLKKINREWLFDAAYWVK